MPGQWQVWHPTKEDGRFPVDYERVAQLVAADPFEAANNGAGRLRNEMLSSTPAALRMSFSETENLDSTRTESTFQQRN
jgi:hypothetical protein